MECCCMKAQKSEIKGKDAIDWWEDVVVLEMCAKVWTWWVISGSWASPFSWTSWLCQHSSWTNQYLPNQTRSNLDQQHSHSSRIWHVWILRWNTKWICIEAFWVTASLTLRRSGTKHHSKHPLNKIWERWMRKKNPNGLNAGKWCCIVTQSNRAELHRGISQFYNQWFWICWSGIVNILLDLIEIKSGQNSGMILGGICTCTIIEH